MTEKVFNDIKYLDEFKRDLKKLKKFRTLQEDLETFIQTQLKLTHKLNRDNKGVVPVSGLGITHPKIYKARKFPCRALKGKGAASGIRVIYAYYEEEDVIEFIEIYYKGDKENEDRKRILKHYGKGGLNDTNEKKPK